MSRLHACLGTLPLLVGLAGCPRGGDRGPASEQPPAPPPDAAAEQENPVSPVELVLEQTWKGPIKVTVVGPRGAAAPRETLVIRSDAEYDAFVGRLPERRIQMRQPAPPSTDPLRQRPPVDFGEFMLVVVIRGDTLSAAAELGRVVATGDDAVVEYAAAEPPPEARPSGIGAYAAARVARVGGEVRFEERAAP